ncbi:PEP-CTERM sorting domain-containing protein, partial [Patescibacteria group bacterium]|nr:PEP-CTERM sorting domain-containing protein [Patescibacteria group bacterium]
ALGLYLCPSISFAEGVDGYTKLLLHNDSTAFTDSSLSSHSVTNSGAQLDTVNKKFGTGSANFPGSSYLSIQDSNDWTFGSGDFTIDTWVKANTGTGAKHIASQHASSSNVSDLQWNASSGILNMRWVTGGVNRGWYHTAGGLWMGRGGGWYHIAFVRQSSNAYIFVNGESLPLTVINAFGNIGDIAAPYVIGTDYNGGSPLEHWNGWIDEVRISKGVARWTSDFTPPTSPYSAGVIPEPSSMLLLGIGGLAMAAFKRKKRSL